jgi:hypothetical protein
MRYRADWLDGLAFWKTERGARLDLRIYIYPDGHGNIHYVSPDTNQDSNLPVPNAGEAMAVLRQVWERAQELSEHAPLRAADEP